MMRLWFTLAILIAVVHFLVRRALDEGQTQADAEDHNGD